MMLVVDEPGPQQLILKDLAEYGNVTHNFVLYPIYESSPSTALISQSGENKIEKMTFSPMATHKEQVEMGKVDLKLSFSGVFATYEFQEGVDDKEYHGKGEEVRVSGTIETL